jgi:nanoRNase/pAp phosphatase (c-di-AMP/oligoRNAs hydrolase)
MPFTDITDILDEINASYVLLLCHHNADPDAICSAYAFQSLLTKQRPKHDRENRNWSRNQQAFKAHFETDSHNCTAAT